MKKNIKFKSKNIVNKNISIFQVMKTFNETNLPIAFIVNQKQKILGSVSDGDIRRAILKKIDINSKASSIMNKKPKCIDHNQKNNIKYIEKITKKHLIRFVPVLKNKKIVDIIDREKIFDKKILDTDVVIMAGGKGKRLLPFTKKIPKPLVKIGNTTILEKIINNFKNEGFVNFTIIVNHFADLIINQIKKRGDLNIKISFIKEKKPLGTIGGLSLIKKKLTKDFILVNADVLTNLNLNDMLQYHKNNKYIATVGCINQKQEFQYGVINFKNNQFLNVEEKPVIKKFINAGIYIFKNKILNNLKYNKKIDAPDFLNSLNKKIQVFPIYEKWIDIGTPEKLIELQKLNNE